MIVPRGNLGTAFVILGDQLILSYKVMSLLLYD